MQSIVALLAFVAVASAGHIAGVAYAPTIVSRAPQFDSAVIKSDRLGGNFAYSVAESHAYAAHTPIVQHVTSPVAVSYSAPAVTYAHAPVQHAVQYAAAPAVYGAYGASPYYNNAAVYGYSGLGYNGYPTILKK